jgi:hypothetical protein
MGENFVNILFATDGKSLNEVFVSIFHFDFLADFFFVDFDYRIQLRCTEFVLLKISMLGIFVIPKFVL